MFIIYENVAILWLKYTRYVSNILDLIDLILCNDTGVSKNDPNNSDFEK